MVPLASMAPYPFVSLTTFRRSGEPVSTPVRVVGDGPDLLVLTPAGTGKLKRIAHTPRVQVRPCSRRGVVHEGAPVAVGHAVVDRSSAALADLRARLEEGYGIEYRLFLRIERLVRRGAEPERVVVRIRPE